VVNHRGRMSDGWFRQRRSGILRGARHPRHGGGTLGHSGPFYRARRCRTAAEGNRINGGADRAKRAQHRPPKAPKGIRIRAAVNFKKRGGPAPGGKIKVGKERLDVLLVKRGYVPSREQARRTIMAGLVRVGQERQDKPGVRVPTDAPIEVLGPPHPYVSRGGLKLEEALRVFSIDLSGRDRKSTRLNSSHVKISY